MIIKGVVPDSLFVKVHSSVSRKENFQSRAIHQPGRGKVCAKKETVAAAAAAAEPLNVEYGNEPNTKQAF